MVGMPVLRGGRQDKAGSSLSQLSDQRVLLVATRSQRSVAAVEKVKLRPQDRGGSTRLRSPSLGVAARAGLSRGQVEDPHAASALDQPGQGSAATQLDVVGMSADGEGVETQAPTPSGSIT